MLPEKTRQIHRFACVIEYLPVGVPVNILLACRTTDQFAVGVVDDSTYLAFI